jgi:hypothetical protein
MDIVEVLQEKKELYNIEFEDIEFQFRLLSMREYRLFNKLMLSGMYDRFSLFEDVFRLCYFGNYIRIPKTFPMGPIITTGELIYYMSGSQDALQLLFDIAEERKKAPGDSIFEHMRAVIITAIPRYTLFDIDNLNEKEFIKCFVIAENILSKTNPNFNRLDLKEIYEKMTGVPEEKPIVQKENVEKLEQALGHWKIEEAQALYEQEKIYMSEEELEELRK